MDSKLISFLKSPDSYPHKPESVTHVQTHISHVFMATPYVYKFKKAVDFGFLDYSSLEKRRMFCHREVELNRRLSDGVYSGIISIVVDDDSYRLLEDETAGDSVVEYAVKMKQLPEEYFLHNYLEHDTLTNEHLDRVAEKLADFYLGQQPDDKILQYGSIENVKVNTDENFEQTRKFTGETINENSYKVIQYFTNQYFEQKADLFERRITQQRIVDGHGDLHLEHIHITPEKVQIYDCIEFNDRFRYGDLAADLAFLAMDLDFNDRWSEERYFIDRMSKKLDDLDLPNIINFYKCYRAYVKGKVKSMQSREPEVPKEDRERARQTARQYFDLSLRYALLGSYPKVLIFMGGVGTGKSTLAKHIGQKMGIKRVSSDRIRKTLGNVPLNKRVPSEERDQLYSKEMSERTYNKLLDKMEKEITDGKPIVIDATFSNQASRSKVLERLEKYDVSILFVEVEAPESVVKERLRQRDIEQNIISDARVEDFHMLKERYNAPDEIEAQQKISISTNQPLEETIYELYTKLVDSNIRLPNIT